MPDRLSILQKHKTPILIFILGVLIHILFSTLIPFPSQGFDWFRQGFTAPYSFSQSNFTITDKPPLYPLLIQSVHTILGTTPYQFYITQILSIILSSLYLFPSYFIARKLFSERAALYSTLFLTITPFLTFNTVYTWSKNLSMFFILGMIYFLFFSEYRRKYLLSGILAGLAFLSHNYALFYILPATLLLLYRRIPLRTIISFIFIILVVISPYYLYIFTLDQPLPSSRLLYYPIAINGYVSAFEDTPTQLWSTFHNATLSQIILPRISNVALTFTPIILTPYATAFPTHHNIFYYTQIYAGGLSTLMYIILIIFTIKLLFKKTTLNTVLLPFLLFPWLIANILTAWQEWGLLSGILHPTIPLLIILGTNELLSWNKPVIVKLIFATAIIENLILLYLMNDFFIVEGGYAHVAEAGQMLVQGFQIDKFISSQGFFSAYPILWIALLLTTFIVLCPITRSNSE